MQCIQGWETLDNTRSTGLEHGNMHRFGEEQDTREYYTINNKTGSGLDDNRVWVWNQVLGISEVVWVWQWWVPWLKTSQDLSAAVTWVLWDVTFCHGYIDFICKLTVTVLPQKGWICIEYTGLISIRDWLVGVMPVVWSHRVSSSEIRFPGVAINSLNAGLTQSPMWKLRAKESLRAGESFNIGAANAWMAKTCAFSISRNVASSRMALSASKEGNWGPILNLS